MELNNKKNGELKVMEKIHEIKKQIITFLYIISTNVVNKETVIEDAKQSYMVDPDFHELVKTMDHLYREYFKLILEMADTK